MLGAPPRRRAAAPVAGATEARDPVVGDRLVRDDDGEGDAQRRPTGRDEGRRPLPVDVCYAV